LSLPGATDGEGQPYFITEGADPSNFENRLYLKNVLAQLKQLEDKVPKLVILDPVQTSSCWPIGVVHDDFVRKLKEQEEAIRRVPNLVVMCACDVDQLSWVSDEWGQSAFAHYLLEGMKRWEGGSGGLVTVRGLFKYVHDHVHQWAHDNRDAVQTPILVGDTKAPLDVELVQTKDGKNDDEPKRSTAVADTWGDLGKEWQFV